MIQFQQVLSGSEYLEYRDRVVYAGVEAGGRSVSFSASRKALQWRSLWPDFPWNLRGALGVGRYILEAAFVENCG